MSLAGSRKFVWLAAMLSLATSTGCVSMQPTSVWLPPTKVDWTLSAESRDVLAKDQAIFAAQWCPEAAAVEISKRFAANPNAEDALAIAELYHLAARRRDVVHARRAAELYVRAGVFAGYVLTAPDGGMTPRALEVYNSCVAQVCDAGEVAVENGVKRLQLATDALPMLSPRGAQEIWTVDDVDIVTAVGFYSVDSINPRYIMLGVGAPVVAVRNRRENGDVRERYFAWWHPFAMTALLQVDREALIAFAADEEAPLPARLEFYDPLRHSRVWFGGRALPLAADISAPLAWAVLQAPSRWPLVGFFRPEAAIEHQGLYMIDRYQPGKIPVVCVHGLLSGPATWTKMINRFRADPVLRDRFQFWVFYYPTGIEFLESARRLRADLVRIPSVFAPDGRDPAPWNMVLVGHSMGGLLSKLQVTYSGDALWNAVSKVPLEQIVTSAEARERLRELFFFSPLPQVRKVVFIATPHEGSVWADRLIGRIGRKLVSLPSDARRQTNQIIHDNPGVISNEVRTGATSVQLLSPESQVLQAMHRLPFAQGIGLYGVIGVGKMLPDHSMGDGVVSIASALLPNYLRTATVEEYHTRVHQTDTAIEEVRTILKEHLRTYQATFWPPHMEDVAPEPIGPVAPPRGGSSELPTPSQN